MAQCSLRHLSKLECSFELNDTSIFYGSAGSFISIVYGTTEVVRAELSSDNMILLDTPDPEALYAFSFRAKVADGNWMDNYMETSGHPDTGG
jgi:hypothetical protein